MRRSGFYILYLDPITLTEGKIGLDAAGVEPRVLAGLARENETLASVCR